MVNTLDEWNNVKSKLNIGIKVDCEVIQHALFGILVAVGTTGFSGVIERVRMDQDGFQTPDEFPPIGSRVRATVLGFRDWSNQIELALTKKEAEDGHDS